MGFQPVSSMGHDSIIEKIILQNVSVKVLKTRFEKFF